MKTRNTYSEHFRGCFHCRPVMRSTRHQAPVGWRMKPPGSRKAWTTVIGPPTSSAPFSFAHGAWENRWKTSRRRRPNWLSTCPWPIFPTTWRVCWEKLCWNWSSIRGCCQMQSWRLLWRLCPALWELNTQVDKSLHDRGQLYLIRSL